jgi:hypothetical protein
MNDGFMAQSINFCTAISYNNTKDLTIVQSTIQWVDSYFDYGSKKACVITGHIKNGMEGVTLSKNQEEASLFLTALKVISYFTIIIPALVFIAKIILRNIYQFYIIEPPSIDSVLPVTTIEEKIKQLIPLIKNSQENDQIQWLSKKETRVFRLAGISDLVFKMNFAKEEHILGEWLNGSEKIRNRFKNNIKSQAACQAHHLDRLIIPQAKIFDLTDVEGNEYSVIAEESLDIRENRFQEEFYQDGSIGLDQSVQQLATFIAITGFNSFTVQNIPVLGDRRIALIHLEYLAEPKRGIINLVNCLYSKNQLDTVLKIAKQSGIIAQYEGELLSERRMDHITIQRGRLNFYRNHGILENPLKLLELNLETLELNLDQTDQVEENGVTAAVSMRQVATVVIAEINRQIQINATHDGRINRKFILNPNTSPLIECLILGQHHLSKFAKLWISQIIEALVIHGHLFRSIKQDRRGYHIEA